MRKIHATDLRLPAGKKVRMSDTTASLCRKLDRVGSPQAVVLTIKALVASSLGDLKNHHLYRVERHVDYGVFTPLLTKTADFDIVAEQWEEMMQVALSLTQRTVPAPVIVQRFPNAVPRAQCGGPIEKSAGKGRLNGG